MKYRLRVEISLKSGHSDPEGETTARLLKELGYKVETADISKIYSIIIEAKSQEEARTKAEEICMRLLANPTKDDYTVHVEEVK